MCKHVAAVRYGVGSRLDSRPELLFLLRDVDARELIRADIPLPGVRPDLADAVLAEEQLGAIFGIDLDTDRSEVPVKVKAVSKAAEADLATSNIRPTGKSVARLRKKLGLSVAEFAVRLGVSIPSVQRWETEPGRLHLYRRALNALSLLHHETNATAQKKRDRE